MNNQDIDKIELLEKKLLLISNQVSPKKDAFLKIFEDLSESKYQSPSPVTIPTFSRTEILLRKVQDFATQVNPVWRYATLAVVLLVVVVPITINYFTNTKRYISQSTDTLIASSMAIDEVSADDKSILQDLDLTQVYDIQK